MEVGTVALWDWLCVGSLAGKERLWGRLWSTVKQEVVVLHPQSW